MKILVKSFIIIILSIVSSYSACDLKAEFGEKKEVFEKREIATRSLKNFGLAIFTNNKKRVILEKSITNFL